MSKILVIDDEVDIREIISEILSDEGYSVLCSKNAANGLATFEAENPDLVILDIWLEGSDSDGIGVLKKIKTLNADVPVLMISGHGNIETAIQTIKLGAYDFIEKPFKMEKLLILVKRAIETYELKKEIQNLTFNKQNKNVIDGHSKIIKTLLDSADLSANSNSRILINGELGTGKEIFARYIHSKSSRANGPFVPFYSFGLTHEAIEEEFLGIEDGKKFKPSIFEKAKGGTLFIDEIHYLPAESQALLLKILQENVFQKIGSSQKSKLDFRLISASSADLQILVEQNTFNKSLFYRLNVIPFTMPALRERKEDIIDLITSFNAEYATMMKIPALKFAHGTLSFLQEYLWPGNIRQLRNTIEWLMIMHGRGAGKEIEISDLPNEITANTESYAANLDGDLMTKPLRIARDLFEKEYFKAQLNRFSGSISKTAEFVEMDRSALHRKLKSLNVSNE